MSTFDKILYFALIVLLAIAFVKFFLSALLILLVLLWLRTWQMKKEPNQPAFLSGRVPNPKPDGFYQGNAGFKTSWSGKKFDAQNATGINVFLQQKNPLFAKSLSLTKEKYKFKTYVAKGLFDEHLLVLKLDYNTKGNPFWIRPILDEIVELTPGHYLGKMHIRLIPGFPFSVLYFELKK